MNGAGVERFDIAIIGAGIAGAGVAALLGDKRRSILIEAEARPGVHATGRSAAILIVNYGSAIIRALTRAAVADFESPPTSWQVATLLTPRGNLVVADDDGVAGLERELAAADDLHEISVQKAMELVPILRRDRIRRAAFEPGARDIDVNALHQAWLRLFARSGGTIATESPVRVIRRETLGWSIEAGDRRILVRILVNAAGAWGDQVAALAGIAPIGLTPLRRSIAVVPAPDGLDVTHWPLFGDASESWYAKPDAGKLLVSPAEEDPVEPQDVQIDDLRLAEGIDRFERATTHEIRRVLRGWAGLRSFVPDRTPVLGFEPGAAGFFWLVGQGGYGIQTAPALSRLAAAVILETAAGVPGETQLLAQLSPRRLQPLTAPAVRPEVY